MSIFKTLSYNIQTGEREGGLAAEIWRGRQTSMTANFTHFDGEYPERESTHTCKIRSKTPVYQTSQGVKVRGTKRVPFDCWRHIYIGGKDLFCSACWHDRIKGFSQSIEKISYEYLALGCLAYVKLTEADYIKTRSKITTHNSRNEDQVNYTSFPTEDGRYLLHDAPGWLGGEGLPNDRAELYKLIETWAETPMGKRAGHGLSSWGEPAQKRGQGGAGKEKRDKVIGHIITPRYATLARFLEENLEGVRQGPNGMKYDEIDVSHFLEILEENCISFEIQGSVTDSREVKNTNPLVTVTNEKPEGGRSGFDQPVLLTFSGEEGVRSV